MSVRSWGCWEGVGPVEALFLASVPSDFTVPLIGLFGFSFIDAVCSSVTLGLPLFSGLVCPFLGQLAFLTSAVFGFGGPL